MKYPQTWIALVLCAAVIGMVAHGAVPQTRAITLQDAIANGNVTVSFHGTGASSGDAITMRIAKTPRAGASTLNIEVPPGSKLVAGGNYQNMVIQGVRGIDRGNDMISPTSSIVLTSNNLVTYVLSAFCLNFGRDNPPTYATFSLLPPDPTLQCLSKKGRHLSTAGMQAAFWMETDRISYFGMREKFSVSQSAWDEAAKVHRDCIDTRRMTSAQTRLGELGYKPGPIDGARGQATLNALKEFQADNQLLVTGELDAVTEDAFAYARPKPVRLSLRDAQERLKAFGYDPGPADGKVGPKTVKALKEFQSDNQLPVTGEPDAHTLEVLAMATPRSENRSEQ